MSKRSVILKIVTENNGIKSREIAYKTGLDVSEVNSILYGELSAFCQIDSEYKWRVRKLYDKPLDIEHKVGSEESVVMCPTCGAKMIKRQAKKGSNAGNYFWGCVNYPRCQTIVNVEGSTPKDKSKIDDGVYNTPDTISNMSADNVKMIRQLYAMPYNDSFESYFFQTCGVPTKILKDISNCKLPYNDVALYSRFRLDFASERVEVRDEHKHIFSLMLRLLNRGRVTTNSDIVEKELSKMFGESSDTYNIESLNNYINYDNVLDCVDSPREAWFASHILKDILGDNYASHYMTQVSLSTIIDPTDDIERGQRIDFLISQGDKNVVVEIDGREHSQHKEKDEKRDSYLVKSGYNVIRINNLELEDPNSPNIAKLDKIGFEKSQNIYSKNKENQVLVVSKIIHQIQIALAKGLEQGFIKLNDNINFELKTDLLKEVYLEKIYTLAVNDFIETCKMFAKLYDFEFIPKIKIAKENALTISFGNASKNARQVIIRDFAYKDDVLCNIDPFDSYLPMNITEETLEYFLRYIFKFEKFQEGQYDTMERLLKKKDSIVLLPTGSGKSLIYQLTSLIVPGQTVVVSPITSLMDDQLDNLQSKGIDNTVAIYSAFERKIVENKLEMMKYNNYSLTYISPERLQMVKFRDAVKAMLLTNSVYTVAIDEAHCVSEWGHDFRTAYLNIGKNSREIFKKHGESPVVVALTGTASTAVLKDIQRELQIKDYDAIVTPQTFDRPELDFSIYDSGSWNKSQMIQSIIGKTLPSKFGVTSNKFLYLNDDKSYCGIVFCPNARGQFGVEQVAADLELSLGLDVGFYSGKASKGIDPNDWNVIKRKTANEFKRNQLNLLVATKAFGMGIDKPNIRYTIHYGIPGSIESFYQEAGRAGRDKNKSECVIVFSNDNERVNEKMLNAGTSLKEVQDYVKDIDYKDNDDISRMLYFHVNAFKGIDNEMATVKRVLGVLFKEGYNSRQMHYFITTRENEERNDLEKAIQRLVVLGVLDDYSVDYSSNEYDMKMGIVSHDSIIERYCDYVRGYNEGRVKAEKNKLAKFKSLEIEEFVLNATRILIEFVYDTIEKGRRRGLREMVSMSKAALNSKNKDAEIRNRIIRYFESTYSEEINDILESSDLGFAKIKEIFDGMVDESGALNGGIRSANEATGIRGQVSRYLESTPDHPGLLFLRSLAETYTKNYDFNSVKDDFINAIQFALNRYSANINSLLKFIVYFMKKCFERENELYDKLLIVATDVLDAKKVYLSIIESDEILDDMRDLPTEMYVADLCKETLKIIKSKKE